MINMRRRNWTNWATWTAAAVMVALVPFLASAEDPEVNMYGNTTSRNMVLEAEMKVQRPLAYAIVDEVDNVLIDEARTPLIISGQAEEPLDTFQTFAKIVPTLEPGVDFTTEAKSRTVSLT